MDDSALGQDEVIEFKTQLLAEQAQAEIHNARVEQLRSSGYTIINNEIVPKNALTGEDDLTAQRTTCWDVPAMTADKTYIVSDAPDDISIQIPGTVGVDYTISARAPDVPDTGTASQ